MFFTALNVPQPSVELIPTRENAAHFFPYNHLARSADPLKPRPVARGFRIVAAARVDAASVPPYVGGS
jgi:hypothetical protein